jgi:predicted enzyme related to lactoylglutathione lyase
VARNERTETRPPDGCGRLGYRIRMTVTQLFPILLTRDLPRLVAFYERTLQAVVEYRFATGDEDDYVSLTVDGASLGIGKDPKTPDAASGDRVALWFYVDDVDAVHRQWMEAGGDVVQEPQDMPWGERVAQVRDPDGNLVNLGAQPG